MRQEVFYTFLFVLYVIYCIFYAFLVLNVNSWLPYFFYCKKLSLDVSLLD